MTLNPPGRKILLHVCCAPCSGAIIEKMAAEGLEPTVFWSNSNICTAGENSRRLAVLEPYAASFGVPVVVDRYDHAGWLEFIKDGLSREGTPPLSPEDCPERGKRCALCFRYRLLRAARHAAEGGFDCLATSLASSRWKNLEQVDEEGRSAVAEVSAQTGKPLVFWAQNWRKGGLQPRRNEIIREQGFYNQTFCGCEFSLAKSRENQQKQ